MGGTVMGFDPKQSVVNDDLRVHGTANLYIASCSTFPSGGSSNPTFTMMALALRLSERLTRLVNTPQNFGRVIELVAIKEQPHKALATSAAAAASSIPTA
jgi:choline dehydrogenase-like flavoprotein